MSSNYVQAFIYDFRDDPVLHKSGEISSELLNAIKDSKMFVVVLSEDYARSAWCLNEHVEILNCKRTVNQVVPVFYHVDLSDLRHQRRSFGAALEGQKKRYLVYRKELEIVAEIVVRQASTKVLHLDEHRDRF
ncbi:TMV resistance protein N-like [Daucus carota subsp. sativus]|uniref:TMV resistance protein N-like n=1 Tax=Daucus carota subsp. sativus TaxID=79200 RepID=UPI0007EFDF56|nr:PREDICTED: TMV resistance protein N-like [Daucus carota subsp. sativus]